MVDVISSAVKISIDRYPLQEQCFDAARHDSFLRTEAAGSK